MEINRLVCSRVPSRLARPSIFFSTIIFFFFNQFFFLQRNFNTGDVSAVEVDASLKGRAYYIYTPKMCLYLSDESFLSCEQAPWLGASFLLTSRQLGPVDAKTGLPNEGACGRTN